ncbi:O-antigen ligase family protein [Oleiharenicola sp. Vm1]|uniref:O-antigen ligase family protein n=1 Tax=Oleiharenicola sp. Vm1 TaxID=3398393 RepID=UPI0039F52C2A
MNIAAHKHRPPLHPLERALVTSLCAEAVFLPWAFGTMHAWSQILSAGLAGVAFSFAIWPRNYLGNLAAGGEFRLVAWPRLLRFPLFWLGGALLVLLGVQAANVAWEFQMSSKAWWMHRLPHVEWIPAGVWAPFERYNVWRSFLVYGAAWLCVCALWIGITRRRSLQIIFAVLVVNAVVLAGVGFIQRILNEPRVLWIRTFKDASSFASFVYQNHGGAYFGLIAAVCLGLALWHFFEGRKRMARSTPAPVWLILTAILVFAVLTSLSRGAVITLVVFGIGALMAWVILRSGNPVPTTTPRVVTVVLSLAFLATLFCVLRYVDFENLSKRFREMATMRANTDSVASRVMARKAALDMYRDYWLLGSGAGSYRYLFTPIYVRRYPEIYRNGRDFWEHAHIDWLEIPTELGLIGVLLIASAWGWCLRQFARGHGWLHPIATMVLLGCCQTLIHAVIDFPFQNPAVMITWWVVLIGSLRWLELESVDSGRQAVSRRGACLKERDLG